MNSVILSVHYNNLAFLEDQWSRISCCEKPKDATIRYVPVTHHQSKQDIVSRSRELGGVHVREKLNLGGFAHGESLAIVADEMLPTMADNDFFILLDHDAHPLDADLFKDVIDFLDSNRDIVGFGVPQFHRNHVYVHPSCSFIRADAVREMGVKQAFHANYFHHLSPRTWDAGEGFTIWCEDHGKHFSFFRTLSTKFPWAHWDSLNVPNGGTELIGPHREQIRIGNLMSYGFQDDKPLVSHCWSAANLQMIQSKIWIKDVHFAFLSEPFRRNG